MISPHIASVCCVWCLGNVLRGFYSCCVEKLSLVWRGVLFWGSRQGEWSLAWGRVALVWKLV